MVRADRIQELMDERGWGNGELATYSGVKYDTIYKVLGGGRRGTTADTIARIAIALNVSLEYLLDLSDTRQTGFLNLNATLREMISIAEDLPDSRCFDLLVAARAYQREEKSRDEIMDFLLGEIRRFAGDDEHNKLLSTLRGMLIS